MMEKEMWLKFRSLLLDVSEGKLSVDQALTIVLKELKHLEEKEENALPDDSRHHRNVTQFSDDVEIQP